MRYPLSTLYGAAGANHDPALTNLLLDAGADPNDGELLYHSLENPAAPACCWSAASVSRKAMRSIARSTLRTMPR